MNSNKEVRLASITNFSIEKREEEANTSLVIEGYASIYNSETLIGDEAVGFYEVIEAGAFEGANLKDVPLKYNHSDAVPILARTRNGSLELTTDDKGLKVKATLLDTQDGLDFYKRVKAGLIDKMSFAFTIAKEEWEENYKGNTPRRVIKKFDRIFDVSVVDVPAYDDTSIYARSLELADARRATLESEEEQTSEERQLVKMSADVRKIILLQGGKL